MAGGGLVLRLGGTVLRFIQFAASIVQLGIFSYFLAILVRQNIPVVQWLRAVEGLSGAAALYTLFGIILTCFLGGVSFFAALAMFLDILFVGANIAIAIETRGGDRNCNALINVLPLRFGVDGLGDPNVHDYVPSLFHQCTLLKATFVLAIINAILFFLSIFYQLAIAKHHRKEKRTSVGPNTPTLVNQKRSFWRRRARADVEKNGDAFHNNAVNY